MSERTCRSRSPPRLSFRSGSSRKATSPCASCESRPRVQHRRQPVADPLFPQPLTEREQARTELGVACQWPGIEKSLRHPQVRLGRLADLSQGPHAVVEMALGRPRSGTTAGPPVALTSGRPSWTRTRSRSLPGARSPRPRLPTASKDKAL